MLAHCFMLNLIVAELPFYLTQELLTVPQGRQVIDLNHDIIKKVAVHSKNLILGLGIKEHMIFAPIAHDWKEYNKYDNCGEVVFSKL